MDEGGAEAFGLHLHPVLRQVFRGQLALGAGGVDPALELAKGDLADDGVEHVLDLAGEQEAAALGVLFGVQELPEGELLAEDGGGFGEREGGAGHEHALIGGKALVDAVTEFVGERHDVPVAPLVVHEDVGVHRGDGRVAKGAAVLAGPGVGVDPALVEEALDDGCQPRREAPVGVEDDDLGVVPVVAGVDVLGQGRVAVPVFELVQAHPAGLEGVVAVRKAGVGASHGLDEGVDDLVLDLVGEVAPRDRALEVAPAVLDRLVLGEGVGDAGGRGGCCG